MTAFVIAVLSFCPALCAIQKSAWLRTFGLRSFLALAISKSSAAGTGHRQKSRRLSVLQSKIAAITRDIEATGQIVDE